jgi:uncharacterized membrane protein
VRDDGSRRGCGDSGIASINAVLNNKGVMVLWGAIIVAAVALGFLTAFLGLAVLLPLIGHATWHGYRETIEEPMPPQTAPQQH